jgi:hypothetical protein
VEELLEFSGNANEPSGSRRNVRSNEGTNKSERKYENKTKPIKNQKKSKCWKYPIPQAERQPIECDAAWQSTQQAERTTT